MDSDDRALIASTLAGDQDAFKRLYEKYVKRIYNLAYRLVGRDGDPEEMTQEIFYQVYRNLANFEGKSQFYTWLYRVAMNTCLQHVRKAQRDRGTQSYEELEEAGPAALPPSSLPSPEDEAGQRLLKEDIAKAILGLPENQRAVLVLGPVEGRSYDEIAEVLGVTVTVVKGRMHRAREAMRALFRRGADEGASSPAPESDPSGRPASHAGARA